MCCKLAGEALTRCQKCCQAGLQACQSKQALDQLQAVCVLTSWPTQEAHEAFNAIECALHEHAASMHRHHSAISKGASAAEDPTQPMSALLSAVGEERAAFTGVLEEVASIVCRPLAGSYSNLSTLDSPEDTPGEPWRSCSLSKWYARNVL